MSTNNKNKFIITIIASQPPPSPPTKKSEKQSKTKMTMWTGSWWVHKRKIKRVKKKTDKFSSVQWKRAIEHEACESAGIHSAYATHVYKLLYIIFYEHDKGAVQKKMALCARSVLARLDGCWVCERVCVCVCVLNATQLCIIVAVAASGGTVVLLYFSGFQLESMVSNAFTRHTHTLLSVQKCIQHSIQVI